jgi:hypothetical protein
MQGFRPCGNKNRNQGDQRQGGECVLREHSGLEALTGGVLGGDGTNPFGELLNKHTRLGTTTYGWCTDVIRT